MTNYCKTCCHDDGDIGFCDKCYYNHIMEEKGIPPTEYEAKPKPITNADRIRAMADEELAGWLSHHSMVCVPGKRPNPEDCVGGCEHCWLDWLRQEVTDGETAL